MLGTKYRPTTTSQARQPAGPKRRRKSMSAAQRKAVSVREILGGEAEGQGTDVVWTHSTSTSSATRATEANRRHGASIFTSARSRLQPLSTSGLRRITVTSRCGRVVYPAA